MAKSRSPNGVSPIAEAMHWVSRITVIALEMVLPGIGGQWLDRQGGSHWMGPTGFLFGITVGMFHLVAISRESAKKEDDS